MQNEIPIEKIIKGAVIGIVGCIGVLIVGVVALTIWAANRPLKQRALQSEAKVHLAQVYTYEKSHYIDNKRYALDLSSLGWSAERQTRYVIGFAPACAQRHAGPEAIWHSLKNESRAIASTSNFKGDANEILKTLTEIADADACADPADGFIAYAVGNIDDDPDLDVWTIDHNRKLVNLRSDLSVRR